MNRSENMELHHGACSFCRKKNILVIHYNYRNQPINSYKLCAKCLGAGISIYSYEMGSLTAKPKYKSPEKIKEELSK